MSAYVRYYTQWYDKPDPRTPITAAAMQHVEDALLDLSLNGGGGSTGGSGAGVQQLAVAGNSDGTITVAGLAIVDLGGGLLSVSGTAVTDNGNGTIDFPSTGSTSSRTVAAGDYTTTSTDYLVSCTGTLTLTLGVYGAVQVLYVTNESNAGTVTVTAAALHGPTTIAAGHGATYICDSVGWRCVGAY